MRLKEVTSPSSLKRGFSLIEFILVIALIGILAGISIPLSTSITLRADIDTTATDFAQRLRRAQTLAQASVSDSRWGAHVQAGTITVFRGSSYASRVTTSDETTRASSAITTAGPVEFVFERMSGLPLSTGTTTITLGAESRTINVNSHGTVTKL